MLKNGIMCEFLKVEEAKNTKTGEKFYSVKVLYMDRSITLYVIEDLYKEFLQIPRMTEICVNVDILVKNDGSIYLRPTAVEF